MVQDEKDHWSVDSIMYALCMVKNRQDLLTFYHLDSNFFNSCHHETHPDNELLTVGDSSWRKKENEKKNKKQLILSQHWSQKKRQRFLQGNLKAYLKPANQLSWLTLSITLCSLPEKGVNVRNTILE